MTNKVSTQQWHRDEMVWWDKYGKHMSYQWCMTLELNNIVRSELDDCYTSFLFCNSGKILDLGCGSGWLSIRFHKLGMQVLGIDLSHEQVNQASKLIAHIKDNSINFISANFVDWDATSYEQQFDSVFVNAFLHHLPEIEMSAVFQKIALIVKPGGRIFLYEPLTVKNNNPPILLRFFDIAINLSIKLLTSFIPKIFKLHNDQYKEAITIGYEMKSPHERPLPISLLKTLCADEFDIIEIKGWHLYSLGFAMLTMNIKPNFRWLYTFITVILYRIDRVFLHLWGWKTFVRPQRFILCSIQLLRKK